MAFTQYAVGMTWWKYVQTHAAGEPNSAIAKKLDISASSIGRWVSGGVDPLRAAAFARAYNRPVLEAFVAAGFLTEDEARARIVIDKTVGPQSLTDEQLVNEISRRLSLVLPQPVSVASENSGDQTDYDLVADDADGHDHEDEDEGLQTDP